MTKVVQWRRAESFVQAELDLGLIILDVQNGRYYSLNETAFAIWRLLESARSVQEISGLLVGQYDVPADHCEQVTASLIATLQQKGLVEPIEAVDG
jgi:hypothetical protein